MLYENRDRKRLQILARHSGSCIDAVQRNVIVHKIYSLEPCCPLIISFLGWFRSLINLSHCLGYYCPERTGFNVLPCPTGTFSPNFHLSSPQECLPCSSGFYCDAVNSTETSGRCMSGFYCRSGSDSQTPSDGNKGIIMICEIPTIDSIYQERKTRKSTRHSWLLQFGYCAVASAMDLRNSSIHTQTNSKCLGSISLLFLLYR
jgi:hypothetical protein